MPADRVLLGLGPRPQGVRLLARPQPPLETTERRFHRWGELMESMNQHAEYESRYFRTDLAGALAIGCRNCGVVVWDQETHDAWHAHNDRLVTPLYEVNLEQSSQDHQAEQT